MITGVILAREQLYRRCSACWPKGDEPALGHPGEKDRCDSCCAKATRFVWNRVEE